MPPSGGSSGSTMQTSNNTNTSGPNPFIAGKLESLIGGKGGAWEWIGNNFDAPAYFPNGTVAPRTAADLSAENSAWGWGNTSLNGLDTAFNPAISSLTDTLSGKYLDPNLNTAFQDYLSASFRPQAEQFRDILAPSIDAKFAGAGRSASPAHFDTTMRGVQDLERAQADAAAKAGLGLYQGERGLMSSAASALPGVLNAKTGQAQSWLGVLDSVGKGSTAEQQRRLDAENAKYSYDTTGQLDWYNRLAQSLISMYPGGQTSGSGTSYGTGSPGGGGVGSILGPGLGIAGLGLQAASLFSDERLKEDIKPVGELNDGQTVYSYRYKGEPATHIGLLAQEVEQVHPEAVSTHPSGFKMVDYKKAVPSGGLL
jgi:hypothetical protein